MQLERQEYIDIFRGLGIILMVMGHIGFGDVFKHFIHAFHMPMFFVISGFFKRPAGEVTVASFIWKKANTLLVPYFSFGLFHFFIYLLVNKEKSIEPLLHLFWVNTEGLPIAGALWFLTSLFFTNVMYFIIERYIINVSFKWITVIVIAVFGNLAEGGLPFTLPYALGASMVGVGLFHIGYVMFQKKDIKPIYMLLNMGWLKWIISAIFISILIFINGYVNMRTGDYAIIPLFWINAVGAVIVGMNFSQLVFRCIQGTFFQKWLCGIGRNSMTYVCLNQVVIATIRKCCTALSISIILSKIIILIISFFALALCNMIFTKSKLKVLIGKR